jgi:hypothetical protein
MSHTMLASASTANLVAKTPAQHPATPVHTALDLTDSQSQKLVRFVTNFDFILSAS